MRPNYKRWLVMARDEGVAKLYGGWFGLLKATRPLRDRLGLRGRRAR